MFEKLLKNEYFCIAVVLALIVVTYLYSQKRSCDIENMRNVDLTTLAQELTETPWVNRNGPNYKMVGNKFDRSADGYTKKKLQKNGYPYTSFLGRSDDTYLRYINQEGYDHWSKNGNKKMRSHEGPTPLDSHPELSQCQPCKCEQDDLIATSDDQSSSEEKKKVTRRKN